MSDVYLAYHRQRERQCRGLAQCATDPEIRRRHEELAQLHATAALRYVAA